jgi:FkbM family methyltransferase
LGRLLRWPLRFVPTEQPRRILAGAAAGLSWYPGAGPHGVWLGLYERVVLRAFAREIRARTVVWDVGAHGGLYALLAASRGAAVVAFEPLAENLAWLARNLEVNGLAHRVRIEACALGAHSGSSGFEHDVTRMMGHLSTTHATAVPIHKADDMSLPIPEIIKIDVEGAELDVLAGARASIAAGRPPIFLETHAPVSLADCLALLPGYSARQLDHDRFLCRHAGPRPAARL